MRKGKLRAAGAAAWKLVEDTKGTCPCTNGAVPLYSDSVDICRSWEGLGKRSSLVYVCDQKSTRQAEVDGPSQLCVAVVLVIVIGPLRSDLNCAAVFPASTNIGRHERGITGSPAPAQASIADMTTPKPAKFLTLLLRRASRVLPAMVRKRLFPFPDSRAEPGGS